MASGILCVRAPPCSCCWAHTFRVMRDTDEPRTKQKKNVAVSCAVRRVEQRRSGLFVSAFVCVHVVVVVVVVINVVVSYFRVALFVFFCRVRVFCLSCQTTHTESAHTLNSVPSLVRPRHPPRFRWYFSTQSSQCALHVTNCGCICRWGWGRQQTTPENGGKQTHPHPVVCC